LNGASSRLLPFILKLAKDCSAHWVLNNLLGPLLVQRFFRGKCLRHFVVSFLFFSFCLRFLVE
jgi:hypothetical protein